MCNILTDVRINSIYLSEYHRNRFYKFKSFSKYFDLPILVISAVSSSFAVGAQPYLNQKLISLVSCATGVVVSVIVSVKLYLNINESMNLELKCSKEFYTLAMLLLFADEKSSLVSKKVYPPCHFRIGSYWDGGGELMLRRRRRRERARGRRGRSFLTDSASAPAAAERA